MRRFFTPGGIELKRLKPRITMIDYDLARRQSGWKATDEHLREIGLIWRCAIPRGAGGVGIGRTPTDAYERWKSIQS